MGMDVYVGPLTRYTLGEWLTVVQQAGLANGVQVEVLRPESAGPTDPGEVEAAVSTWQLELLEALGGGAPWADGPGLPYWTDKPDWDGYGGLVLAAAYAERPDLSPTGKRGLLRRAATDDPREFEKSAAYIEASKAPTRFRTLLHGTEWWLPVETGGRAFRAQGPDGKTRLMAPVSALLTELRDLSEVIGLTDRDECDVIRRAGPPADRDDVEGYGRFGLAVFLGLAAKAYVERQPLLLDY
jgi:hypothetical protein